MSDIKDITKKIRKFRDARDWMQFHNHKDMALSMILESAEVLEHFQWKSPEEMKEYGMTHKDKIAEELADVAKYLFELADNLGIDLAKAIEGKMKKDGEKYPVEKSRGSHKKYTEL